MLNYLNVRSILGDRSVGRNVGSPALRSAARTAPHSFGNYNQGSVISTKQLCGKPPDLALETRGKFFPRIRALAKA